MNFSVLNKKKSAYVKCLKMFLNFYQSSSYVHTNLLPSFGTVCHNAQWSFLRRVGLCYNRLVQLVDDFF